MRLLSNTWLMLAAACLAMTLLAWQAHGQTLPIVGYCIEESEPEREWAEPYIERAFELAEQYYAFITAPDCVSADTVHVEWVPIAGAPVGLAYAMRWGYPENKIELDSTYSVFEWEPDWITVVVGHELLHIVGSRNHSRDRYDLLYFSAWRLNPRYGWGDMRLLLTLFGRYRPIPQNLVGQ